jgi:SNF2 family DNA or RNA helicase
VKYRYKRKPYSHQVKALKKLLSTGFGGALLMEPRTGKTKVAVDYSGIMHMAGHINRVLIFCPVGVMGVWREQIEANCPLPYRIVTWDRKARKRNRKNNQRLQLPGYGKDVLDFVIVNYDALSTPGRVRKIEKGVIYRSRSRGGRYDNKRELLAWQPQLCILDESHRIKTPSAKKTTALVSMSKYIPYRIIMTGTVVTKKKRLYDIYPQWKFLNPNRFPGMTAADFKARYARFHAMGNYSKWLGNLNEPELHGLIHQDAFSITREECFDLPKMTPQIIPVELDESYDTYVQMAEDMVARIRTGEITEASIQLVQRLRLQQITSGLAKTTPSKEYPTGRLVVIGDEKIRVLQSRLEDLMEADEKVVIGALFKADIQRIKDMAQKLKVPVFVIAGGVKPHDREYARTQFPKVNGGAVFIGQPAAAGEGIDLSCASILQWYSLPSSWVHFRQFSDRIALSDKPTFHEFLLARGTVDELIYQSLLEDGDVGKMMITSPERLLKIRNEVY